MVGTLTRGFSMLIQLNDNDLAKMPSHLSASLSNWLQHERLNPSKPTGKSQLKSDAEQLTLNLLSSGQVTQKSRACSKSVTLTQDPEPTQRQAMHTHVKLSQLFNAGFTRAGMAVRVKLKQELVKQRGHEYITRGLAISSKGTVIYNGQEFDKPSPLAKQINGSAING